MSSDMEQGMAKKPDTPRNMSPEELEQALRWLEDISAGRAPDAASPDEVLDDSPFRNLFELEEGDLPDWLREAPRGEGTETGLDMESRLDWLAKMAGRESVDELPTLEWRRLTAQTQESLLGSVVTEEISTAHMLPVQPPAEGDAIQPTESTPENAPHTAETPSAVEAAQDSDEMMMAAELVPLSERPTEPYIRIDEAEADEPSTPIAPEMASAEQAPLAEELLIVAATVEVPAAVDVGAVEAAVVVETGSAVEEAITEPTLTLEPEPIAESVVVAAAEVAAELSPEDAYELPTRADLAVPSLDTTSVTDATPHEGEIPELDDMDAAMAWLEELAANQSTPIEDLPSVADRALASRLIAEASQIGFAPTGSERSTAVNLAPVKELDEVTAEAIDETAAPVVDETPASADLTDVVAKAAIPAADEAPVVAEPPSETTKRKSSRKRSTKDKSSTKLETAAIATAAATAAAIMTEPAAEAAAEVTAIVATVEVVSEVVPEPEINADTIEPVMDVAPPEAKVADLSDTEMTAETEPGSAEQAHEIMVAPAAAFVAAAGTALTPAEEHEAPIEAVVPPELEMPPAPMVEDAVSSEPPTPPEPLAAAVTHPVVAAPVGRADLSQILDLLDGIAVASQVPLDELEDALEAEGMAALATPYSLDSTLDWLMPVSEPTPLFTAAAPVESTPVAEAMEPIVAAVPTASAAPIAASVVDAAPIAVPATEMPLSVAPAAVPAAAKLRPPLESSLLDEMPDDPDAALDWMRQFAEDEPSEIELPTRAEGNHDTIEFSDSMLMEMPDDPDEAIAWLEKLASQGRPTA